MKLYHPRRQVPSPIFEELGDMFLGATLALSALDESATVLSRVGLLEVVNVVGQKIYNYN